MTEGKTTDSETHFVGLIGWPVEHSVSPAMHNAAFDALGLHWRYTPLPTPPGKVKATLTKLKEQGYRGANVTVPHKQVVMPHLDETTGAARDIGAVNTIVVQEGQLIGHNTDGDGFLAALREAGFEPAGRRALVLGAGGAARAVVYGLAQAGCTVAIHNRTVQRAAQLAHHMQRIGVHAPVTWVPPTPTLLPGRRHSPCRPIGPSLTWSTIRPRRDCWPRPTPPGPRQSAGWECSSTRGRWPLSCGPANRRRWR
jgi:shikimate 5-dehydrogenase